MVIVRWIAAVAVAAVAAFGVRACAIAPLQCDRAAATAEARTLRVVDRASPDVVMAVLRDNIEDLAGCESCRPADINVQMAIAVAHRLSGHRDAAVAAYQRALAVSRRPEIYYGLGIAELEAANRPAAIEAFTAAVAFDPAILADIPFEDVRAEVARRITATYGPRWLGTHAP